MPLVEVLHRLKLSEDDKPTRFRDDPEFFTQRDIRCVDLANVAARLLTPSDNDFANAALRALRLMHVCASVLNWNRKRWDAATRAKENKVKEDSRKRPLNKRL